MECFRLGSEGNNASVAPLIAHGRVTLEQSGGRYRLHISSEQPVNDSPVQLSLRKGCGAEVTKNYLFSVPAGGNRQFAANDRPLRLPRARQFDVPREVAPGGPATREWQLARKTTARDLARKRHPGNPAAQARYLRALQAANPDVDLGSRGQNRLPANTWLSIPGKQPRFAGQSTAAVRAKPSPDKSASAPIAPPPPKKADRVIVSSGQPGNDNPAAPPQRPVIDVAAGDKIPRKGGPGITRSDLLVINKIDLAPHVGADLAVMDRDSRKMRGALPFVFTNLHTGEGLERVVEWIEQTLPLHAHPH
jgi:hypothetical protein